MLYWHFSQTTTFWLQFERETFRSFVLGFKVDLGDEDKLMRQPFHRHYEIRNNTCGLTLTVFRQNGFRRFAISDDWRTPASWSSLSQSSFVTKLGSRITREPQELESSNSTRTSTPTSLAFCITGYFRSEVIAHNRRKRRLRRLQVEYLENDLSDLSVSPEQMTPGTCRI